MAHLGANRDAINRIGGPIGGAEVDAQCASRAGGRVPVQITAARDTTVDQIVERVEKSTGVRVSVHQYRHTAGALILRHRPGEYELVRRILGHKSIQTTIRFYLSLETTQASEIFTGIIRNRLDFKHDAA